jgi:DNA-binding CsgD family transcriptional regulator
LSDKPWRIVVKHRLILLGQLDAAGLVFSLDRCQKYIVGRASTSDIVIRHESVSRTHAEVTLLDPGIAIKDLGSRNGTFVDEDRVTAGELLPAQRIRFGQVSFVLAAIGGVQEENSEVPTANCASSPTTGIAKPRLTPGRGRVFDLLVLGQSEKEIAGRLKLSASTVHHHIQAIYRAMGVTTRAEFLVRARPRRLSDTVEIRR